MNIKALIVDDESSAYELLLNHLKNYAGLNIVGMARNVEEALNIILKEEPDLIFLDTDLPGRNGFELIHELQCFKLDIPVIFITAHHEFAVSAFRHNAVDFLLKPINEDELAEAIEKYKASLLHIAIDKMNQLLNQLEGIKIKFNYRNGFILIDPQEIIYCKADGNYTDIFMVTNEQKTVTMTISKVFDLLKHNRFIKPTRSLILNKDAINKVDRKSKSVSLKINDHEVDLSLPRNKVKFLAKI